MSTDTNIECLIIDWIRTAKPNTAVADIRSAELIQSRILDSMQFLDFVYFLNELCGTDLTAKITVEDMRTLSRIVAFVKAQSPEWRMAS